MEKRDLDVIQPIDRDLLKKELNKDRFVRKTNHLDNEIYIIDAFNSPNVLKEIGRLREISFRAAGGGTGEAIDLDELDTHEIPYQQLIVYNPKDERIIGGYRFIDCNLATDLEDKKVLLSTAHYFNFSDKFEKEYLPYSIELGRSWIQPDYQPSVSPRKGMFALSNLWDGLGALVSIYPQIKYFFGKVTMYPHYDREARDILMTFMAYYFPDRENLVTPIKPYPFVYRQDIVDSYFKGQNFKKGHRNLRQLLAKLNESIPPLINVYMGLSETMKTFGTAINPDFGDVEETGILIKLDDIYEEKKKRHVQHDSIHPNAFKLNNYNNQ